jgi:hypothetical protein
VPETLTIPLRSRIVKKSYSLFNGRLSSHQQPASEPATRAKKKLAGWLAGWWVKVSSHSTAPSTDYTTTTRTFASYKLLLLVVLCFFFLSWLQAGGGGATNGRGSDSLAL